MVRWRLRNHFYDLKQFSLAGAFVTFFNFSTLEPILLNKKYLFLETFWELKYHYLKCDLAAK